MPVTIPNTFSTGAVLASEVNANFTSVATAINGGITDADISANAAVANTKLANSLYEVVINCRVDGTELAGLASGDMIVVGAIPYDATDAVTNYTILGIEHMTWLSGAATTAATFDLDYGYGSSWSTVKSGITVGDTAGFSQTRVASFNDSIATDGTNPKFFRLEVTNTPGGYAATNENWTISIKLKRDDGLRS